MKTVRWTKNKVNDNNYNDVVETVNTFIILTVFKLSVPRKSLVLIWSVSGVCLRVKLANSEHLFVTIGNSFRPTSFRWGLFVPSTVGFYIIFPR